MGTPIMLKKNMGKMNLKLSDFLLLYSTEIFMITETSRIIGITVLGDIKSVSNGMEKSEKPKPVVPCRRAARKIMIEPRIRILVSTFYFAILKL